MRRMLILLPLLSVWLIAGCPAQKTIKTEAGRPRAHVLRPVPGSPASNVARVASGPAVSASPVELSQPLRQYEVLSGGSAASTGTPGAVTDKALAGPITSDAMARYLGDRALNINVYPQAGAPPVAAPTDENFQGPTVTGTAAEQTADATAASDQTNPVAGSGAGGSASDTGAAQTVPNAASNMAYAGNDGNYSTGAVAAPAYGNYAGAAYPEYDANGNLLGYMSPQAHSLYIPGSSLSTLYTLQRRGGNVIVESFRPYTLPQGVLDFRSAVAQLQNYSAVTPAADRAETSMVSDRVDTGNHAQDRAAGSHASDRR